MLTSFGLVGFLFPFFIGESYLKLFSPLFQTGREKKKCSWYCFSLTSACFRFQAVATVTKLLASLELPSEKCSYGIQAFKQSRGLLSSMMLLLNSWSLALSFERRDSICQIVLLHAKPQTFLSWLGETCHMFDISLSQNPSPFACMWGVLDLNGFPPFQLACTVEDVCILKSL